MTENDFASVEPNTDLTSYLEFAFEQSPKTEAEIAREMGYARPAIIAMMRSGATKVPVDRIPAMAQALNVDPTHLLTLALEEYCPQLMRIIEDTFGFIASHNEREWIAVVRHLSGRMDPRMT